MRRVACVLSCALLVIAAPGGVVWGASYGPFDDLANTSWSPSAPTVHLSATELSSFESALTAISKSAQITIVSEGFPFHASLTPDEDSALRIALPPDTDTPVADAVAKIASAYDYDAEETSVKTFVLRKRYSDPNELPLVTFGEVMHALRSLIKFLSPFNSEVRPFRLPAAWKLYESLNIDQAKAASEGGISLAAMSPEQQSLALNAAGQMTLWPQCIQIQQALDSLTMVTSPKTSFQWFRPDMSDELSFGYKGKQPWAGNIVLQPLTNWFKSFCVGYTRTLRFKPELKIQQTKPNGPYVDSDFDKSTPDHAVPTDEDQRLAAGMMVGRLPSTLSLRDAATSALRGSSGSYAPSAEVSVDDAVADKPVCVYGENFSTNQQCFAALCEVYGLELSMPEKDHYVFSLPRVRQLKYNEDPGDQLRKLIPPPMLRSLSGQKAYLVIHLKLPPPKRPLRPPTSARSAAARKKMEESERIQQAGLRAADAWYFPAVRRLLVLAQPLVPVPEAPPVPIIKANPEVLRLLAIMMISGGPMMSIDQLARLPFPTFLLTPEKLAFKILASRAGDGQSITVTCTITDSNGIPRTAAFQGYQFTQKQIDAFATAPP